MKVYVSGARGYLGSKLSTLLLKDFSVDLYTDEHLLNGVGNFDLSDEDSVSRLFAKQQYDVVIHCAGKYSQSLSFEELIQANYLSTKNLIKSINNTHTKLVYFSSGAVFDSSGGEHFEYEKTLPASFYGKSKVMAEDEIISKSVGKYLIIRPSMIYGLSPISSTNNFLTAINNVIRGASIEMDDSWKFTASYIDNIYKVLKPWISQNESSNIAHVSDVEPSSKYLLLSSLLELLPSRLLNKAGEVKIRHIARDTIRLPTLLRSKNNMNISSRVENLQNFARDLIEHLSSDTI